jgi:hypothetical protein
MFCPKCATQNIEGAHFCRSCGANISLVPHAMTGQLPTAPPEDESRRSRRRRRRGPPNLDEGIRSLMMGIGFIAVALALAVFGRPIGANVWWFWMLIPAFGMMGKGISDIVHARQLKSDESPPQLPYASPPQNLPRSTTNELKAPVASVTEGTTRHLGTEAPTQHFDSWEDQKPS